MRQKLNKNKRAVGIAAQHSLGLVVLSWEQYAYQNKNDQDKAKFGDREGAPAILARIFELLKRKIIEFRLRIMEFRQALAAYSIIQNQDSGNLLFALRSAV